jgi:hypothetical protein
LITAAALSVLFLCLGLWKGRYFLASVVSIETLTTTYFSSYGDKYLVLFGAIWISVYSFSAILCRKNSFIVAAYALLIVHTLFNFAISSLYSMAQTSELYYLALSWYYIYWPVFALSVGLIITGLVKNDRSGRGTIDNLERVSDNSQLVYGVTEYQYKRHHQRFY